MLDLYMTLGSFLFLYSFELCDNDRKYLFLKLRSKLAVKPSGPGDFFDGPFNNLPLSSMIIGITIFYLFLCNIDNVYALKESLLFF